VGRGPLRGSGLYVALRHPEFNRAAHSCTALSNAYNYPYGRVYERSIVGPVKDIRDGEILPASRVRDYWSDTLDAVEQGRTVFVTRREHQPATIIDRDRYLDLVQRVEELEEALEVALMLSDKEVREGIARGEEEIAAGEGLSFEEAFNPQS
jgi:PHD/YefM family antitoxin component YafN of YafNO toxin-antitoxin module